MGEKQGGVWQAGGQRLHGVYAPRELVYTPEASGLTSEGAGSTHQGSWVYTLKELIYTALIRLSD